MLTRVRRPAVLIVTAAVVFIAGTTAASAHVTVAAPGVSEGDSDATIVFRVPTESATADTVGLKLQLPVDTPLVGVLVAPIPGWTSTITSTKLTTPITTDDGTVTEVVSEIDWSAAAGSGTKPGYFQQFTIIAGQLPDKASTLTFKAIQNYSDGTEVDWIETPAAGSTAEPEHPAPVLDLAAASSEPSATGSTVATDLVQTSRSTASSGAAATGIVLGAIGTVLGAAALGLTLARRRRAGH